MSYDVALAQVHIGIMIGMYIDRLPESLEECDSILHENFGVNMFEYDSIMQVRDIMVAVLEAKDAKH